MAVMDKDRPRGLRVPSLSTFRSKNKQSDPTPTIQLPSPSQLSLHTDSLSIPSSYSPLQKALPPQPLPPSPPQPSSPAVINPYPSPPHASSHSQPSPISPISSPNSSQYNRNGAPPHPPHPAIPPSNRPMARPIPPPNTQPTRRPVPGSAPVTVVTAPGPQYAPAPILSAQANQPVNLMVPQQRTPPSSEGDPEQRLSNGTSDSLEDFIPDPEPEPELDGTSGTPNEAGSSEEDDRPWTPPEVEPVPVPLNKLHYSCYQEHRAMPAAANVWYALPCMACQKFDREIRHRCVFCCLRVCADCFQALKKIPRRSLAQLMETIEVNGNAEIQPSEAKP
ncbi:hypothetical protein BJY01DRAFT_229039 [Aspergillus pseudoustus]|uniref:FYVE zinc finger-domain-containing protein n=1 Tax=Aspergillus pseudoustus TaxID=1810923 RepID=A0ABR4IL68_9EURO